MAAMSSSYIIFVVIYCYWFIYASVIQQEYQWGFVGIPWQTPSADYGKVRLIGSAAFILGVMVFGGMIGWVGRAKYRVSLTALLSFYTIIQLLKPTIPQKMKYLKATIKIILVLLLLLKNQ